MTRFASNGHGRSPVSLSSAGGRPGCNRETSWSAIGATGCAATWIAEPVLAHMGVGGGGAIGGTVLGRFGSTLHAEFNGFAVVVQPEGASRMPNGIGVRQSWRRELGRTRRGGSTRARNDTVRAEDPATLGPGRLRAGGLEITWEATRPPAWNPAVPKWPAAKLHEAERRARAILAASERLRGAPGVNGSLSATRTLAMIRGFAHSDPDARRGVERLLPAVQELDPDAASEAAGLLVGRGSGLTPVGDDILAAAALALNALGCASGRDSLETRACVEALIPADVRQRTTPISATLLELARRGDAIAPARILLDPRPIPDTSLGAGVKRLAQIGHSTGASYVNTIGALMFALATPAANQRRKELVR